MGSAADTLKTKITRTMLARSSDPDRISRRAAWLRQGDDGSASSPRCKA